ncbi:MAG TPA: GNAT family N-acetyltransferase [Rhodanobacteraceae bacterium]|nr:GNAT family N-acetyltransferase [Rhodanobacteraceae bacterium]
MSEALGIRRATIADAAALTAFAARAFIETFGDENDADDLRDHVESTYNLARQSAEIRDADTATLLVERDAGALIGYAQICRKRVPPCVDAANPVEIYRFYVERAAHGSGVAQRLMAAAFAQAREWGADVVWLGVWEHNPRAMAFYRKFGFADVGSIDFFVGPDRQTDRVFVVPLAVASHRVAR